MNNNNNNSSSSSSSSSNNNNNSIGSILENAILKLTGAGVENPKLNAEFLLCKAANISRLEIYLQKHTQLAPEVLDNYYKLLERRVNREPLQYIEEEVEFFGLKLNVNSSVLIPRPETEELVNIIKNTSPKNNIKNILDIGTGSGCIALALSNFFPKANILGIDVNNMSISTSNSNKNKNGIKNVNFKCCKIEDFTSETKFDLIVSNPPYVSAEDYFNLEPELFFEPKNAITDNRDGLYFYHIIASKFKKLTNTGAKLFLECGNGQSENISNIFSKYHIKILKDFNNIDRFLIISA